MIIRVDGLIVDVKGGGIARSGGLQRLFERDAMAAGITQR